MPKVPNPTPTGKGSSSNPGSGARLQLAAVGKQDVLLRGTKMSHFRAHFKRATRFAVWTEELSMDYQPGKRTRIDIPKSGDMLGDMYLEIRLPATPGSTASWPALMGYTMLKRVRLLLDGHEVHNFERLWFDLYDSLYTAAGHEKGLDVMVGRTPLPMSKAHVLYVPLRMLTCRPGPSRAALPLQAIPRSKLCLDIEWDALPSGPTPTVNVLVDYIELEDPEKSRLVKGTMLAFESAIDSDGYNYYLDSDGHVRQTSNIKVNLANVRFAVKALVWIAYEENTQLFTYLPNPVDNVYVTFNNQDRFFSRPSEYFSVLQKYEHTRRAKPGTPSIYSFAFDATARQPSGVADFGALSRVDLLATVNPTTKLFKLKVFSLYYNFVEIKHGSARVVFV